MDEARGRAKAEELKLVVIGTIGILIRAKEARLVPLIGPALQTLRTEIGFHISDRLLQGVLTQAGE